MAYFQVMNSIPVKISTLHVVSRAKKAGRQNHVLTQWKMLHCKTIVNIITYDHVV
jgi:hypothetical protein